MRGDYGGVYGGMSVYGDGGAGGAGGLWSTGGARNDVVLGTDATDWRAVSAGGGMRQRDARKMSVALFLPD
jgi:hypothetical protein